MPIFFLADGYLLAARREDPPPRYSSFVWKNARRLLLPWLVFNAAYTALRAAFETAGVLRPELLSLSPGEFAVFFVTSGAATHLYFLPALFLIRLAAPASRRLAARPAWVAVFAVAAYAALERNVSIRHFFLPGYDPALYALWGYQFHLLGIALCRARSLWAPRPLATAGGAAAALAIALAAGGGAFAAYLYLVAVFLACAARLDGESRLAAVGRRTMGIYLLHTPVLQFAGARAIGALPLGPLPAFAAVWAIDFLLAWAGAAILARTPAGRFLTGEGPSGPLRSPPFSARPIV